MGEDNYESMTKKKYRIFQSGNSPVLLPPEDIDVPYGLNGSAETEDSEENLFEKVNDIDDKIYEQLQDFHGLLDTISSIEDKQKALWRQIYENAVQDRRNAYLMWIDLYMHVRKSPTEHAVHGQNLSRYMERMSKANDQILKLADLVSAAGTDNIDTMMNEEDIYDQIQKTQKK